MDTQGGRSRQRASSSASTNSSTFQRKNRSHSRQNGYLAEKTGDDSTSSRASSASRAHSPPQMIETEPKASSIRDACERADLEALQALAEAPGGFLSDNLRRRAWPVLLGTHIETSRSNKETGNGAVTEEKPPSWRDLPPHKDEEQVQLDVNRAFVYYPNTRSDAELDQRKSELSDLIIEVLRRNPYLSYFQGFHDISQVFLLILEPPLRAPLVSRLSTLRIRDFMLPNLSATIAQLRLIPDILRAADPELRRHIAGIEPFYALAGTLTMYAHNIEAYGDIARLFDVLLAHEPVFSVYLFAQIVLDRRAELLDTSADDPSMLHFLLSKLPPGLDLEALITSTKTLFASHPPESLPAWRAISPSSALKTARSPAATLAQSPEDGHIFFERQVRELRWAETRQRALLTLWKYRRPVTTLGLAVAVGLVAIYLRKNPGPLNYLMDFLARWHTK